MGVCFGKTNQQKSQQNPQQNPPVPQLLVHEHEQLTTLSSPQVPHEHAPPQHIDLTQPCSLLTLEGQTCLCYCVSVYDGDTCTVNIYSHGAVHMWKVRLLGFDSPEIRPTRAGRSEASVLEEQHHAQVCKKLLSELILHKTCVIQCGAFEKYGRLLGHLYVRKEDQTLLNLNSNLNSNPNSITTPEQPLQSFSCQSGDEKQLAISGDSFLHVNQWMIQFTPSLVYNGQTKKEFDFAAALPLTHVRYQYLMTQKLPLEPKPTKASKKLKAPKAQSKPKKKLSI
jgi:endonuclease YncB( thermonuclease family)